MVLFSVEHMSQYLSSIQHLYTYEKNEHQHKTITKYLFFELFSLLRTCLYNKILRSKPIIIHWKQRTKKMQFDEQNSFKLQTSFLHNKSEIVPGALLGQGKFCSVRAITILDAEQQTRDDESDQLLHENDYSKTKNGKYALKYLNKETCSIPSQFQTAIIDITVETKILSGLKHPHILKLHGFNKDEIFTPNYFIILERLELTLFSVMDEWRESEDYCITKMNMKGRNRKRLKHTMHNIFKIVSSVSSALSYLHKKKILHRDIVS